MKMSRFTLERSLKKCVNWELLADRRSIGDWKTSRLKRFEKLINEKVLYPHLRVYFHPEQTRPFTSVSTVSDAAGSYWNSKRSRFFISVPAIDRLSNSFLFNFGESRRGSGREGERERPPFDQGINREFNQNCHVKDVNGAQLLFEYTYPSIAHTRDVLPR